ncbi:MAG: hypothetical protein HGB19_09730 [Chlorobiales bacterium]|nr:hypothetical protein [Chlorobiales bacterium]
MAIFAIRGAFSAMYWPSSNVSMVPSLYCKSLSSQHTNALVLNGRSNQRYAILFNLIQMVVRTGCLDPQHIAVYFNLVSY